MSTVGTTTRQTQSDQSIVSQRAILFARLADYVELTKPRIAVLALLTVTLGFSLGTTGAFDYTLLAYALFGIALVASASSALNQLFERHSDARMERTANRPLPSGRISTLEGAAFGFGTALLGIGWLMLFVSPMTSLLATLTLILYAFIYTPLKRRTSLCTAIGAIPGAMPPVLGWVAAGAPLDMRAFCLFGIMFLWQFPHFLAIAWLYRNQYDAAGLKMLPFGGTRPGVTGMLTVGYALVLIPISLMPSQWALAGTGYASAAVVLGAGYLLFSVLFALRETEGRARRLLYSSLVYLPVLLLVLTWDHMLLLR